ncbi:MAG TPA: hypothetical protein VEA15_12110 [Caulobacteraceae bacterium]|nr:hypothetical protein [Caulobacteraceae bacterium]
MSRTPITLAFAAAAVLGGCSQSTGGNTEKAIENAAEADAAQASAGAPSTATRPAADDDRSNQPAGAGTQNSPGYARDGSQGNANNQDTGAPETPAPVEGQ